MDKIFRCQVQTLQSRNGKKCGIDLPLIHFCNACLHVAAQRYDFQVRAFGQKESLTAHGGCSYNRALRQIHEG